MNLSLVKTGAMLPEHPSTATDLTSMAATRYALSQAVTHGDVRRPFRGIHLPSEADEDPATRAAALVDVVTEHHVICDRTAAWVHGIDAFGALDATQIPPVEICAVRGRTRTRDLCPDDITVIGGVALTTPLRTALDLGCSLSRREAMVVLNDFARAHGVTRATLDRELPRFRGRRGVVQLRALVPLVNRRLQSQQESWVMVEINDAGLPLPEAQVRVEVEGIPTYRLDFAYPLARVAIEYDGDSHDDEDQRVFDEERRGWLVDHGWTIIIVHSTDFSGERLATWLREIKEALMATYSSRRF